MISTTLKAKISYYTVHFCYDRNPKFMARAADISSKNSTPFNPSAINKMPCLEIVCNVDIPEKASEYVYTKYM